MQCMVALGVRPGNRGLAVSMTGRGTVFDSLTTYM